MTDQTGQSGQNAETGEDGLPVPQYRGLKTAVIVMGVLLVVGFIVVFSTIIYRAVNPPASTGTPGASQQQGFGAIESLVPKQARTGRIIASGDRLSVEVIGPDSTQIIIYDLRKGIEAGRITLKAQ